MNGGGVDTYHIETPRLMEKGVSGNRYIYYIDADYIADHSFDTKKLLLIHDEPGYCGDNDPIDYGFGKITLIDITGSTDEIDKKFDRKELKVEDYLYKFPTNAYPLDDTTESARAGDAQYIILSSLLPMDHIIYESTGNSSIALARDVANYLALGIEIYYNPDYQKADAMELYPGYIFFTKHLVAD